MANSLFHHEEIYRGKEAVTKLASVKIFIAGAGALGSNLADNLGRHGFQNIVVLDKDRIDRHNVGSQIYGVSDEQSVKVEALAKRLYRDIGIDIEPVYKELTADNAGKLITGYNLVVDCFDNAAARTILQNVCRSANIPLLHMGLFEDFGQVRWDEVYKVPPDDPGLDVCNYAMARNIVMLTVIVGSEEIIDFCLARPPRRYSWNITLKDLRIQRA